MFGTAKPWMALHDKGPGVVRIQEQLDALGIDVGKNDGLFDEATAQAVMCFQELYHLKVDGIFGTRTQNKLNIVIDIMEDYDARGKFAIRPITGIQGRIVDISEAHPPPRLARPNRFVGPEAVNRVVLHQTGILIGNTPKRVGRINTHLYVPRKGPAYLVNTARMFIRHAQALSVDSLGIEVEGNFADVHGRFWKPGGGPHTLTQDQKNNLDAIGVWLDNFFASRPWTVYGHRQSSENRAGDPGPEIWGWAHAWEEMYDPCGLKPQESFGTGQAIPDSW